ncbi:MAG: Gfo/Idh/MocA family oxidoreductase [Phycisphaerae bacterium]|nr:Gfo/Idh/MocA family oxidoreductase [Phycisphaerae bacterium]
MSTLNRRHFLKSSLAAGAFVATGCSQNSRTQTLGPIQPPRRGPNEEIRVACIGFRGQGQNHINIYAGLKDVAIAMLCDTDKAVWDKGFELLAKANRPAPPCVQDLREVYDNKEIDAVSIATPNHWHALATIWAMQAGKHVYVEKPAGHNVSESRRMVEAARKYNRICQVGTQCRSLKGAIDAMDYIKNGKIGKLHTARGLCYKRRDTIGLSDHPAHVPDSLNYELWIGPAPMQLPHRKNVHYDWHWFWDYGNGDIGNQGPHQMDVARWGMGKQTLPHSVISFGGRFGYKDDGETPNTQVAFFDYGDMQLIFEVRGLPTPKYRGASVGNIFYGTEGTVVMTAYHAGAAFDNNGNKVKEFDGFDVAAHFKNFIHACRTGRFTDLHTDILEGHLSSSLCHLSNVSYRLGEEVPFNQQTKAFGDDKEAYETFARTMDHLKENNVPMDGQTYRLGRRLTIKPGTETFENDPQADALLTRTYREPFVVPERI